jgi:hypothetical protein
VVSVGGTGAHSTGEQDSSDLVIRGNILGCRRQVSERENGGYRETAWVAREPVERQLWGRGGGGVGRQKATGVVNGNSERMRSGTKDKERDVPHWRGAIGQW